MAFIERYWTSRNPVSMALWPLGLLFCALAVARRFAYRRGWLRSERVGAPVIVVGNISVGGTGKTPLVIRLVELLRQAGYRPGVVSRGHGGEPQPEPRAVDAASDPRVAGDEPVLLARRANCPVMVDADRVRAARTLLERSNCDVIIADDGLQHYRLRRDIEIAVVDGERRFGNGACLPAGPLREPPSRLRSVDFVVGNGAVEPGEYLMTLVGDQAVNLRDPSVSCHLGSFGGDLVHAVAGIGHPPRFFKSLRGHGIRLLEHPFPDHHPFTVNDLDFGDDLPVLMTEKDAVKCQAFAPEGCWRVPVTARLDPELERRLLERLARCADTLVE